MKSKAGYDRRYDITTNSVVIMYKKSSKFIGKNRLLARQVTGSVQICKPPANQVFVACKYCNDMYLLTLDHSTYCKKMKNYKQLKKKNRSNKNKI